MSCKNPARREFIKSTIAVTGALALGGTKVLAADTGKKKPNVLFVMTDQQRFDTIAALGNSHIYTPNLDRLVKRGVTFTKGYSNCPVCVPARHVIRTGCEPAKTASFTNGQQDIAPGQAATVEERCGKYIAKTMKGLGYRTFGIGKFHSQPGDEYLGYDVQLYCEETYGSSDARLKDHFARFIAEKHPEYDWIEGLMGERTEMYQMPQRSMMPADITAEAWAADRAIELINKNDDRPYFGFVSFVGPHPPCAPPIPFNRMYHPDRLPNPICGDLVLDHMDEQIPWMNYMIWAEEVSNLWARILKSRYYGEISYIDHCLGRILDAVEARPDGDNTVICFYADHGDHLGDHHAWQKESFFEAACHIPYLVSWPAALPGDVRRDDLVGLVDLFGIATTAAGSQELRDGIDVLGVAQGSAKPREHFFGYYGNPGTSRFKIMAREKDWKYIYMANGGREQLFNVTEDPNESRNRIEDQPEIAANLRKAALEAASAPNTNRALDGAAFRDFPYAARPFGRIYQFDRSKGVTGFPEKPGDVLKGIS